MKWTKEEIENLKIDYPNLSNDELEKKYKRKFRSIKNASNKNNIFKYKKLKLNINEIEIFKKDLIKLTFKELSIKYELSVHLIKKNIKDFKIIISDKKQEIINRNLQISQDYLLLSPSELENKYNRGYDTIRKIANKFNIRKEKNKNDEKVNIKKTEIIIKKCKEFNYTFLGYENNKYINAYTKIDILCDKNHIWHTSYNNFINLGSRCLICRGYKTAPYKSQIIIDKNQEEIKNKIIKRCEEKNYIFLRFIDDEYKNSNSKLEIKCIKHNYIWNIKYTKFIHAKHGCPICNPTHKKSENEILKIIKKKCKERNYTFLNFVNGTYKNNKSKLLLKCQKNHIFEIRYANFVGTLNRGCSKCRDSKNEILISNYLTNNNIKFERQKTFDDCKNKRLLYFDFYLPDYNICIEYDGKQHYEKIEYWSGEDSLDIIQYRDNIKNKFCKNNDIILFRIKYNENVINKLKEFLQI